MTIWICIPVFNRAEFTLRCLESLQKQSYRNFKTVICDHGSTDGSSEKIRQYFSDVIIINASSNLWWTGAMNVCVKHVLGHALDGDYLMTLNNDTELPEDYLATFAALAEKYPQAILASTVFDLATGKQVAVGYRQNWLTAKAKPVTFERDCLENDPDVAEVTHASGRGTLFPLKVFRQLGLYDEQRLPHYAADFDFTFKASRAGYSIYVCKNCRTYSHVDATGMTAVRTKFSLKSFINYFTSIRSPANLKVRWWYGWNNCPKLLFPSYITLDVLRLCGSYFKHFLLAKK